MGAGDGAREGGPGPAGRPVALRRWWAGWPEKNRGASLGERMAAAVDARVALATALRTVVLLSGSDGSSGGASALWGGVIGGEPRREPWGTVGRCEGCPQGRLATVVRRTFLVPAPVRPVGASASVGRCGPLLRGASRGEGWAVAGRVRRGAGNGAREDVSRIGDPVGCWISVEAKVQRRGLKRTGAYVPGNGRSRRGCPKGAGNGVWVCIPAPEARQGCPAAFRRRGAERSRTERGSGRGRGRAVAGTDRKSVV